MIKDFLKDMVRYLPAQIVPGIVGFISIPIITRLFPPGDYGNYSVVMTTVMLLTTLLGWLPISIIRFYPAYERDKKLGFFYGNIIDLTFISIVIITLIFLITLFCTKDYLSSKLYLFMYVGIGVFVVTAVFDVPQYFLMSRRQVNWYGGFVIWRSIGTLGIALLLIFFFNRGIESFLWGAIVSVVIILPLLWRKALESAPSLHFKIDPSSTKEMAKYSFPLVAGNLAAWILNLSDRYILEFFRGALEVGIYSASYNIAHHTVMSVVSLFMLASGPISMHIWEKQGEPKSKEYVNKITRYYLMASIPIAMELSVLSKPIINIMTGEQYFEGYEIIPFVTAGIFLLGLQQRFLAGFLYYKRTSFVILGIIAAGLLNLSLNFLFVPKYGYFAAAITTFISYTFLLFLMIILSRRLFVWTFPFKSLVKVTCASAIMGMVVYYLGNRLIPYTLINLIFCIFLGGLIYFVLLFLLREIQPEEKEEMKQVLKVSVGWLNSRKVKSFKNYIP